MSEQLRRVAQRKGNCMECADQGKTVKATRRFFATLLCEPCWAKRPIFVNQPAETDAGRAGR